MRSGMGSDAFRACVVKGVTRGATDRRRLDAAPREQETYIKIKLCDYFVTVGSGRLDRVETGIVAPIQVRQALIGGAAT
jgi:hypothetical protein